MDPPDLLLVQATIHLNGLRPGDPALVDPADPYIADLLSAGYLAPVFDANLAAW